MARLYYGDVIKRAEHAGLVAIPFNRPGKDLALRLPFPAAPSETVSPEAVTVVRLSPDSVGLFDEADVDAAIATVKANG